MVVEPELVVSPRGEGDYNSAAVCVVTRHFAVTQSTRSLSWCWGNKLALPYHQLPQLLLSLSSMLMVYSAGPQWPPIGGDRGRGVLAGPYMHSLCSNC